MIGVPEYFGSMVFNDRVMKARLPHETYTALQKTIREGSTLEPEVADTVAAAMRDWAIEKGATHYTHWFQPMTGTTAEKHDSFITPYGDQVIMEFSGKELIKGESDASSFPSGGLRATFEARGYTAWDPTSYAFIKDDCLCIPTAFCSYGGEVLDKKTPLLRSMEAINKQSIRVLRALGDGETSRVLTTVGAEQEYFLLDKKQFDQRKDLVICGRTLFGAKPPKGQEMNDHYFGSIRPRVREFMKELNEELWKLGVLAKTEHNEVAPAQHELAPVFTTTNVATDHNQITMDVMKKVAEKHGLACILHEKPFAGVNGSGKHNNWSISTNTGKNLLRPGGNPYGNLIFLTFFCAVIRAVDRHQALLRMSAASAGNDNRLGSNEAPPAIISMFVGSDLEELLISIQHGDGYERPKKSEMETGVGYLPHFNKDRTDRNRTSPFAFTGNKFEFRMLGSSASIAGANIILNTIVADQLADFADELEKADDKASAVYAIVKRVVDENGRIIFDGNNYSNEWVEEAQRRGLLNLRTTVDAIPYFESPESIALFARHRIFTEAEIRSRAEILYDTYIKVIDIEALTMLDMAKKQILPAVLRYCGEIAQTALNKKTLSASISREAEEGLLSRLSELSAELAKRTEALERTTAGAKHGEDSYEAARYRRDAVIPAMAELRETADELEAITAQSCWPYPTYCDLLFGV